MLLRVLSALFAALHICGVAAQHAKQPKVALLFAARGAAPLEPVWTAFLEGVRNLTPPPLSEQDWDSLLETERIAELDRALTAAGELTANRILQDAPCVSNDLVRVRPAPHS